MQRAIRAGVVAAAALLLVSISSPARADEVVFKNGDKLTGNGAMAPGIAGRSPSYLGRQLYDFHTGSRHGEMAAPMQPVVAKLKPADLVNLTAYLASLPAKP